MGVCVCVFDTTDRVQHMFWRYLEGDHPARGRNPDGPLPDVIGELYQRVDALVDATREAARFFGA